MTIYPPWSVLCGDCGRTYAAGSTCPCYWLASFLRQNDDSHLEYQAKIEREAAEIEALSSDDYELFKEYVQHLWSGSLTDKAVDMFIRQWLTNADYRRVARGRPDVTGSRAVRNGHIAGLPAVPGSPAYREVIGKLALADYAFEYKRWDQSKSQCPVPVHDDVHPSLVITRAPDRVLLKCTSKGCSYAEIMAALGLDPADGFDNSSRYDDYVYAQLDWRRNSGAPGYFLLDVQARDDN